MNGEWHWRNTALPIRFLGLDAWVAFPTIQMLVHPGGFTLAVWLACVLLFGVLRYFSLGHVVFLRLLGSIMEGPYASRRQSGRAASRLLL